MLAFFRSRTKDITWFVVWFMVITFGASLLGSGAMLFFADDPATSGAPRPGVPDDADTPDEDPRLVSTKPVAKISLDGHERLITEGELEKRLRQTELAQGRSLPAESRRFFLPIMLNRLVEERLILMEAESRKLDVTAKVDEQLAKIYQQVGGKEKYLQVTRQTEAEVRTLLEQQFKVQTLLEEARMGRTLDERELKAYYDAHVKEFQAEGAAQPRPFDEVEDQIRDKLRGDITDADVEAYYQAHRARWMLPKQAHLLHLAVDPRSERISATTTPSEAELRAWYDGHADEYREREKVDLSHIFLDPNFPEYAEKAAPTEDEVQAYYTEHREEFEDEPQALLSQILVGGNDGAERARAALKRVQEGEVFAEVAADVSDDQATKEAKGELGWLSPGELPEALSRVAFEAPVGKILDPIRTTQGYHVVWVRDRREGQVRPLDEVRPEIVKQLGRDKRWELAEAEARRVYGLVSAPGADFAALAKSSSHAASKSDGGHVGVVVLGENEPGQRLEEVGTSGFLDFAIQKAFEGKKPGDVLEPVRSFKGWHVLRLEGRPERGMRPFESVRKLLEDEVRRDKAEKAVEAVLTQVKARVAGKSAEDGQAAFLEAVKELSDSVDVAATGGDWGMVTLDTTASPTIPKEVRGEVVSWDGLSRRIVQAVEALPPGGLSAPVKLSAKHHVFYVAEVPERGYRPFDEVQADIRAMLDPQVSDGEMREYFEQNKAKYQGQTTGGDEVYHVLLRDRARAQDLIDAIRNGQKEFDVVARSEDNMDAATRKDGGRIAGQVAIPSIQKAVAATEAGGVYPEPVKSPVGWHILKVGKRAEAKPVGFEAVRDEIRQKLLEDKGSEVEQGFIKELRNRARIQNMLEEAGGNPLAGLLGGLGG